MPHMGHFRPGVPLPGERTIMPTSVPPEVLVPSGAKWPTGHRPRTPVRSTMHNLSGPGHPARLPSTPVASSGGITLDAVEVIRLFRRRRRVVVEGAAFGCCRARFGS